MLESFRNFLMNLAEQGDIPSSFKYGFVINAMICALLIGPILGGIGTMVVTKKMAFFSEAVGHAAMTGIAIGVIVGEPFSAPYISLFTYCILFGLVINYTKNRTKMSSDTLIGVPILSGGRGGLAVLAGPTGGFFIVWPFAAFLIGFLVEKSWKNINIAKYIVADIIGGIVLVYLVGAIYLSYITKMPIDKAFLATMAFIPGDILKAVIVSILCYKLKEISPINEVVR